MWAREGHLPLLYLFLLFLLFSLSPKVQAVTNRSVDVGVILDSTSWVGNISWSCIPMALEDFYAEYPNYTTRLNLHLRESGKTALGAAEAALDLLKNVQVQAIIGPQTSMQAKFVIELGDRTHVPVISFSAKSPSLSPKKSPYFIRTGFNDSSQAKVVASVIQAFNWKEVVPICEDTEYGNGIVPYLVDAIQEVDAEVPYRSSLPLSATKDQIMAELDKLNRSRTRVFVVHMSYSLGFQLFKNAKEAGMMGQSYVWITTYGLTDLVDLMGSSASDVMQGVLGLKPYVAQSNKLRKFKMRWRKKFYQVNPGASVSEPTVFGLLAYDTVWSLALYAQTSGVTNSTFQELNTTDTSTDFGCLRSSSGPGLRNHISDINFEGISGKFHLIDGQLESQAFEIINFVGHGKRRIGFWTPENGTSGNINLKENLSAIIWPGGGNDTPKGWEWPTVGNVLKIGVPVKPGFEKFVRLDNGSHKGYCIEVFDAVMAQMPYHVPYEYIKYQDALGNMNGTYDDLVYQVHLRKYDAVVGDVTIIANRSLYVDFTLPYTESGVSMVVSVKDKRSKGAWTFLEPLSTNLWLRHSVESTRHHLLSSYTASLTSKLTVEQLQPTVADISYLLKNGDSVGYLNESFMPSLLKQLNFNMSKIIAYQSPEDYNSALSNGTIAAIFDEIPYLKVFLSNYCGKYTMTGPTYKTGGFGFVFPKGSPIVPDVSRAVLKVMEGENMTKFEEELYGNVDCSSQDISTETSSRLNINSFWGLFLITGTASISALLLHLAFFVYRNRDLLRTDDSVNSVRGKLALLAKFYDQRDPSSAPKKPEDIERPAPGDIMLTPYTISEPQSPLSVSSRGEESFENEGEIGTSPDEEEITGTPGREISTQNPDPPSFAEMLTDGAYGRSS